MTKKLKAYLHIVTLPFIVSAAFEFLPAWLYWPIALIGGMSLERIDNSKNYSPDNCKWATNKEQQLNRDITVPMYIDGVKMSMRQACITLNVKYSMVKNRVRKGWNPYKAIETPKLR